MIKQVILGVSLAALSFMPSSRPFSDHGDTPLLTSVGRHDARITDLFAFTRGSDLVIALCTDPTVPPGVSTYAFPSDLDLRIAIDNDSPVGYGNAADVATYGGTLLDPGKVHEDITFRIEFRPNGAPQLHVSGLSGPMAGQIQMFTGLRDDPFIRGPRIGRNVAAVVLQMPLSAVLDEQSSLLIWATAKVPGLTGPFQDLAGRSLRSMFPENYFMNSLKPRQHYQIHGAVPDVVIFDTSLSASYPNGRELTDDVVDLVGDPRILANDAPFPVTNDVPFLATFPYLAPPQP